MRVTSQSFEHRAHIPDEFAFGVPDPDSHVRFGDNRNPQLSWSDFPEATRSFVITCIDEDAPAQADDVNQEGREVPKGLARAEFVHWLLANMPAQITELWAGSFGARVMPGGLSNPQGPTGSVQGQNDYTSWFADDPSMRGIYCGYDGPCPPWNDARIHQYHFCVYALDVERLELGSGFGLGELRSAMEGHVLDVGQITGLYTLNPRLRNE